MSKIITYSFCENFIVNLADHIEENYVQKGQDLSRIAVVFGGKRPALFLKRELARRIKTGFYPPRFFTIDEFVSYAVRKTTKYLDSYDLDRCFLLYQLAKKKAPSILKGRETFAQFLPWTREILNFIDQLDLENVPNKSLRNIESNAQIGYSVPDDINELLEHIVKLREAYHQAMEEEKIFSRGYQYLKSAQQAGDLRFDEFDQILFCNFFYFNRSEEEIVKGLYGQDKATLIFQGDERRWPVLKRIAKNFNCQIEEGESPQEPKFKLNLYSGFDIHSQVCQVREILRQAKDPQNTVIVLPDPDHIIPLLSELAGHIENFNISMGYPLKRSSLYSLFEFIFKAQLSRKQSRYYTKDYLKALRHPFIKNLKLSSGGASAPRILVHKIEEILIGKEKTDVSGSLFIELGEIEGSQELYLMSREMLDRLGITTTVGELKNTLKEIHLFLFAKWEEVQTFRQFAVVLAEFTDLITHKSFLKDYPLNLNIAAKIYMVVEELQSASFYEETFPQEEIFRIFESRISREMVSFLGSPLKGLQVLGLFETRSLNFENVIFLDVNEGVLPRLNIYEPLIPREVMISLNLDRLELEEEIQRYQFMRLISSAKNVHLVYQKSKDKERSRFVEELIWEEQKKKSSLEVIPIHQAAFEVKVAAKQKSVKKTPEMIRHLTQMSYSASSLNMYLRDPMEFYTSYVLGLREKEDLLDEPEARHVGTFVHELLEESYKPFLKKKPRIDARFNRRFQKIFDAKFAQRFGRSMKSDSFLLKSVLQERMTRFLENEQGKRGGDIDQILFLEQKFEDSIRLSEAEIKFKYIVDRIDRLTDGTIMIIDYKTGSIDQMPKAIDTIASMELSRESIRDNLKSFQIPLYFHYLNRQYRDTPINAALYNLRTLELHRFIDSRVAHQREDINKAFLRALDFIIAEILNPKVEFVSEA